MLLINALGGRLENSEIWKLLVAKGWTEEKLLGSMKKKSLFLLGKAEYFNLDSTNAIVHLQQALDVIKAYGSGAGSSSPTPGPNSPSGGLERQSSSSNLNQTKEVEEIKDLLAKAKARQASENKKEKSMWSKAFKDNNTAPDDDIKAVTKPMAKDMNFKVDLNKLVNATDSTSNNNANNNEMIPSNENSYLPLIILCFGSIAGILGIGWRFGWFKRFFK